MEMSRSLSKRCMPKAQWDNSAIFAIRTSHVYDISGIRAADTVEIQHDCFRNNFETVRDIRGKNNIWINAYALAQYNLYKFLFI